MIYKAFITYSHADSKEAGRLHRALERYRVPSRLVGTDTPLGKVAPRIGKIFRDREELPAGGKLTQSLLSALEAAEFLIVICSPSAPESRWVKLEIEAFLRTHPENRILCYIVAGGSRGGEPYESFFPSALRYHSDSSVAQNDETVAADSRKEADGVRLARLKLISGLLGIGLDQLVQREAHRRQRQLLAITAGALAGMLLTSTLAWVAVDARKNEVLRRAEAEDLIEFMLSDLRDRLDAVGRLDIMEVVGEKAADYYSQQSLQQYPDSSLGRRARTFHLLGEVDDLQGDLAGARGLFEQAHQSTQELLQRNPQDAEAIFNHAQSVFWTGYLDWHLGDLDSARQAFMEYLHLAEQLVDIDPHNAKWLAELASANVNMGAYEFEMANTALSIAYLETAESQFLGLRQIDPGSPKWQELHAQALAWLADANRQGGSLETATEYRRKEAQIYRSMLTDDPGNARIREAALNAELGIGISEMSRSNLAGARAKLVDAREMAAELLALEPDNTFTRYLSGLVHQHMAQCLLLLREYDGAGHSIEKGLAIAQHLLASDPDVVEWIMLDIRMQQLQAWHSLLNQQVEAALLAAQALVTHTQDMYAGNQSVKNTLALARSYDLQATVLAEAGQLEGALDAKQRLVEILVPVRDSIPVGIKSSLSRAISDLAAARPTAVPTSSEMATSATDPAIQNYPLLRDALHRPDA